jgi:thioester reductase-like protein
VAHSGLFRASGLATDTDVDLTLIAAGADGDTEAGAVPHAELLTRFVDAAVTTPAELPAVRGELVAATDEATMVDAAAVIAAFEMMTRIADGTGTTHPSARLDDFSVVRDELHLDEFESARRAER